MLSKIENFFTETKQKYSTHAKKISSSPHIQLQSKLQQQSSKVIKWKDGTTYVGECRGKIMQGKGQLMFINGDYYEGYFKNNNFNGFGKYHGQDGIYEGQWNNGIKCGQATETTKNGDIFKGRYQNGMKQGIGTFQWADGSYYQGMFKNDQIEGQGRMLNVDGSYLQGQFKCNTLHGKGKQYFSNGNVFVGFFQNGIKHGIGKLIDKNKKIEGCWTNGDLNGEIIIYENDGICKMAKIESNLIFDITDQQYSKLRDSRQFQVNFADLSL